MESIPGLLDAYERKTGMRFIPGTLNVELEYEWNVPDNSLRLEREEYNGTVSVYIVPVTFMGRKAFILRTEKNQRGEGTHPKSVLEIACDVRLRDNFKLEDGDDVEINIDN